MTLVFAQHNPYTWYTDPKESTAHALKIAKERGENGFSVLDWINFCDYLSLLNVTAVKYIARYPEMFPNVSTEASSDLYNRIGIVSFKENVYNSESDEHEDYNLANELQELIVEWNMDFYKKILPNLPFAENYSVYDSSRIEVLSRQDLDNLGSFIVTVLHNGIQKFHDEGMGFPAGLSGNEDDDTGWIIWQKKLESYIELFDNVQNWPVGYSDEVFEDFRKYFPGLWD